MARPRQYSDEDLLKHARRVFLKHGPSVSTTVIASACGMSQAALFKRFSTKQELLLRALLPPMNHTCFGLLAKGPSAAPLRQQLIPLAQEITDFFCQAVPAFICLRSSGINTEALRDKEGLPPLMVLHQSTTRWFEASAARLKDINHENVALMFLGALHLRAFSDYINPATPTTPVDAYIEQIVDNLINGVQP